MNDLPPLNVYGALALVGILLTAFLWGHLTGKGSHHDSRLTWIYFAGLLGALVGAKLAFLFAEGWHYRESWLALLSGRSITGGLLGGYLGVEIAKRKFGYPKTTGDVFAIIVPLALVLGRIGCVSAGCCPGHACDPAWWAVTDPEGVTRWPAAHVEGLFNVGFLGWMAMASWRNWTPGNRFHVYLIAYGAFRFAHEFRRDDIPWFGSLTGYHVIALAMFGFGLLRFMQRRREMAIASQSSDGSNLEVPSLSARISSAMSHVEDSPWREP